MAYKKKLIEVALPLEAINAESAREKSIRHGHPSTLHLWWARRPLAAARAVIWASLVDDPSSHPDLFPTEELQKKERERLFGILSRLVVWENSNDPGVLAEAKIEIMRSTGGNPPALLDPFAGGGAIPLEAQRLGLKACAHDLNPVAVMINKAMIEIPPKFAGHQPVNPEAISTISGNSWSGISGLAEDVRYYGEWMKKKVFEIIGDHYPKVKIPGTEKEAVVVAWIWARTVKCPNPVCGCRMPLVRSFVLSKKKGHETYVDPIYVGDHFEYDVKKGIIPDEPTIARNGAKCYHCGASVEFDYIRKEARAGRMSEDMMAVVAEGSNGKIYIRPDAIQINAAKMPYPEDAPDGEMPEKALGFRVQAYGIKSFQELYTNRQLTSLCKLCEVLEKVKTQVELDAIKAGLFNDHICYKDGGIGAKAYSEIICVYLQFVIDKIADINSSIASWINNIEAIRNTFARQAIPMVWDFCEANIFSSSAGCFANMLTWVVKSIQEFPKSNVLAEVRQFDAQSDCGLRNIMVSTDPPYYDNIDYSDLSDFFYIWMRKSLKNSFPSVFKTMLVPKAEELIATPFRFDGDTEAAKRFFEDGMYNTCCQLNKYTRDDIPLTIYYAFKQSDTDEFDQTASSGWETMLAAIIRAGFVITGTWPMRTERGSRMRNYESNALASSIVLVCRKREEIAKSVTKLNFINALHREMIPALQALQSANIAPVDLAQSAIGPGIGVFSRYKSVIDSDGSVLTVRAALQIINQELDAFYNEQEGDLDAKSRFCVELFSQYAFNTIKYGDADILARAKNTSVQALVDEDVMEANKGVVRLKTREELPINVDENEDCCWKITQQLAVAMSRGGVKECARVICNVKGYVAENAKALAYRLYTICERKNWATEGRAYNNLIVAWPDILSEAAALKAAVPEQLSMLDQL